MKKKTIVLLFMTLIYSICYSQESKYSDEQIKPYIEEVFGDKTEKLFFSTNKRRLEMIKEFLSRVEILNQPKVLNEKTLNISFLKLNNKYNKRLKHDEIFNKKLFNPLKYKFNLYPKKIKNYRIDNNYIISIKPNK
jgi:hypothetical protein